MRPGPKVTLTILAAATLLQGCAGTGPPPEALLRQSAQSSILSLSDPEEIITWDRLLHPQANSTFMNISGTPYYVLGAGDEIEVLIDLGGETRTMTAVVSPEGSIRLPELLGHERVPVAGLAVPHAESLLTELLSRIMVSPIPELKVTRYNSAFVTLVGEVMSRPADPASGEGRYVLTGRTDLLTFILTHSSTSEQADISSIIVTTAEGKTGVFDVFQTIYSGDKSQNPLLEDGDFVTVPSLAVTRSRIYVLGDVERPGLVTPRPGLTIMDALAEVGGLNERAATRFVSLVRGRDPDAEVYSIPYRDIVKKGSVAWNVPLNQGDIIYVSRSSYDTASQMVRDLWAFLQAAVVITVLAGG